MRDGFDILITKVNDAVDVRRSHAVVRSSAHSMYSTFNAIRSRIRLFTHIGLHSYAVRRQGENLAG